MTLRPPSDGFHLANILDEVADWTLNLDASDEVPGADIRYTQQDAMNALHIFFHVCNNIAIHQYQDADIPLEEGLEEHAKNSRKLADVFKELTGIDSRTYYKQ